MFCCSPRVHITEWRTFSQIERMKKLVGRKGFSNNPAAEISDVMALFEGDMAELQRDIASLQR